jgi:hypothetical protein
MPSFSLRRLVITTMLLLTAFAAIATSAQARLMWTANAELPWNQEWANYSCQDGSRVKETGSVVAQGGQAYEIEVRDGDDAYGERCELGQGNPTRAGFPLYHPGDERWISWQMLLPDDYPIDTPTWNNFMQLKQLGDLGTPAVSMEVQDGNFIFMNSDTNHTSSGKNWWWQGKATRNRWVKFTLHVKFSSDPNVGFVEIYGDLDGQGMRQLMARTYMHTMKVNEAGQTVDSQSRIGLYRDPKIQGTSHIYFDGYSVGDDRDSVEAAAFGPAGAAPAIAPPAGNNTSSNPTSSPKKATPKKKKAKHKYRVWLRTRRGAIRAAASPWAALLPIYGGVRPKRSGSTKVIIQIREHGRWHWLTRGSLRKDGRFYMAPSLDSGHVVKLRAVVPGVGRSKVLKARIP